MPAPSTVRALKTGSSGSSAEAPATIKASAPSRRSARNSSATARSEALANRTASRRLPSQSIFCFSADSNRARCRGSRLSRATAPIVHGRKPATVTTPPVVRPSSSIAWIVCSAIASGVTLALATASPATTGCPLNSVKTEMPS